MNASDMSDDTNPDQSIVKLAEGAEVGMLNATHITRDCNRLAEDLELVRGEDLRRAVARELMKRDDSGDLADVAREIMRDTDVEMDPWADVDPCPGCGRQWHQASYEYRSCDYGRDDETWCRECAAAHADDDELDDERDDREKLPRR